MTTDHYVRVWVGDLDAYNNGRLVGQWVEGTDWEALTTAYNAASHKGTQDYEVMDMEGPKWARDAIGSYGSQMTVYAVATLIEALEESGVNVEAFDDYNDMTGALTDYLAEVRDIEADDINDVARHAESLADDYADAVTGHYESREDYAQQMADDTGALEGLPYWIMGAIDWAHVARELELGGANLVELSDGSVVELSI